MMAEVPTSAPSTLTPYAECQDCDAKFADRDAVTAHQRDTMTPTGEEGITARSHRAMVVNPTDAERRESRLRWRISDGLDALYNSLYEEVERGTHTVEEIREAMWPFDLLDGWDQYAEDDAAGGSDDVG